MPPQESSYRSTADEALPYEFLCEKQQSFRKQPTKKVSFKMCKKQLTKIRIVYSNDNR
jgi:hypothetical protein